MSIVMLGLDNEFIPLSVLRRKYQIITYQDCWVAVDSTGNWVGLHIINH